MLITLSGASGTLGKALSERLLAAGHQVRWLSRVPRTGLPSAIDLFLWDASRTEPPQEALQGSDAIVHLAGEPVAQRWTPAVKKRLVTSRVDSTRLLVQAISTMSERPKALLSASAVGFYGDRADQVLSEKSAQGEGFLADLSADWEYQAMLARSLGLRVNVLRTGIVLSRKGGALPEMLPAFRAGLGGKLGSGQQWMSWIHIEDWVELVMHLLEKEAPSGPVNFCSPEPVRNADFSRRLGLILKRPSFLGAPAFALNLLFGEMASILLNSQRVVPQFALEQGYEFRFGQLEGALQNLL